MKGYDFCCPKQSKTINQWDARDAPMKSIEGTCQDWLQLLTGGITQDALHMHSATVALVAAPAICCLHLNMLHVTHVHWLRQNAHRSVLRFQTFFLHFGFSKSHSPQGWAKGPDNPQEVDSPEGWTLAKSWAANCLSEGKNIVFYCFSQVTFVKIQKKHERLTSPNDPTDYMHVFWCIFAMAKQMNSYKFQLCNSLECVESAEMCLVGNFRQEQHPDRVTYIPRCIQGLAQRHAK